MTVARTILKWIPQPYSQWRGKMDEGPDSCTIVLQNKPVVVFDFFGVNSAADHDRFQSYEATGGVWIEEPCPLATNTEFISSGVAESALATADTSVRGAPFPTVQVTGNPPPADHWVAQLWHLPGYEAASEVEAEMGEGQLRAREAIRAMSAVYMLPSNENAAEKSTPGYLERMRNILDATGHSDLTARLVEGRVGYAQIGAKVTPEFHAGHLDEGVQVVAHVTMLLAFDYGLNPSCIAAQVGPRGHLLVHRAWSRRNMGIKQLLEQDVQPWLTQQPVERWSYCGGHEATEREQSNSEETALRMIVRTLGTAPYQAGPVSWSARREGLRDALTRSPGGQPWVRIHPRGAAVLVRALDGGWYYPTDGTGRVRNEGQPDKRGPSDHVGDAFGHLCAVLLRKTDAQARGVPGRARPVQHRGVAAASSGGSGSYSHLNPTGV